MVACLYLSVDFECDKATMALKTPLLHSLVIIHAALMTEYCLRTYKFTKNYIKACTKLIIETNDKRNRLMKKFHMVGHAYILLFY